VITEGAKSALAQIAASTIHHPEETAVAADAAPTAEAPVERAKKPRKKRKEPAAKARTAAPKTETDILLDSVLEALPEPKAPGQGRARRRVTTAALTGVPVAHTPNAD
jgi:ribonuclease E